MATKKELEENKKLKQKAARIGSRRAQRMGKVTPEEFSEKTKKIKKELNLKKGGMVIAPKSGSAHYKSNQSAKSIAKKYFKGGIN